MDFRRVSVTALADDVEDDGETAEEIVTRLKSHPASSRARRRPYRKKNSAAIPIKNPVPPNIQIS